MRYELVFRPDVVFDVAAARDWYNEQSDGLGDDFADQYRTSLDFLKHSAHVHRVIFGRYRRILLDRFPFSVWYEISGTVVVILLVWDCRQDPERLSRILRIR